jgi:DNA invertase Pin-like site-specific DNA recombinase
MMRVIGYARVSTGEQGLSLADQCTKIKVHCELHEIELVRIYQDHGASGRDLNRQGIRDAMFDLSGSHIDGMIITKLDRLSRSIRDWAALMETFTERDKSLIAIMDSIDTTSAGGLMVANVIISIAQWERQVIQERTVAAFEYMRSQDMRCGLDAPYGWELDPDRPKYLRLSTEESQVCRLVYRLRDSGLSYREVADLVNDHGYVNRAGNPFVKNIVSRIYNSRKRVPDND